MEHHDSTPPPPAVANTCAFTPPPDGVGDTPLYPHPLRSPGWRTLTANDVREAIGRARRVSHRVSRLLGLVREFVSDVAPDAAITSLALAWDRAAAGTHPGHREDEDVDLGALHPVAPIREILATAAEARRVALAATEAADLLDEFAAAEIDLVGGCAPVPVARARAAREAWERQRRALRAGRTQVAAGVLLPFGDRQRSERVSHDVEGVVLDFDRRPDRGALLARGFAALADIPPNKLEAYVALLEDAV